MEEENEEINNYFDPKNYLTHIVGIDNDAEEQGVKDENKGGNKEKMDNLISLLTDPAHKSVKEQTLLNIKKEKKGDLLLLAIANPDSKEVRHKLIAACWESEIDYSKYLPFFILLAIDKDYLVSLEAMTVISTMEGPFDEEKVKEGIQKVKTEQKVLNTEKAVLLNDLVYTLEGFIAK